MTAQDHVMWFLWKIQKCRLMGNRLGGKLTVIMKNICIFLIQPCRCFWLHVSSRASRDEGLSAISASTLVQWRWMWFSVYWKWHLTIQMWIILTLINYISKFFSYLSSTLRCGDCFLHWVWLWNTILTLDICTKSLLNNDQPLKLFVEIQPQSNLNKWEAASSSTNNTIVASVRKR